MASRSCKACHSTWFKASCFIKKLIDFIIKTDEIRKHQERLKKKKVFDKLEQKKVEKDRLKAELGNIPPLNALKVLNTRAQKKNQ